jgi:hypothetical protein
MISEEVLDSTLQLLETKPVDVADFYESMTSDYPVAISWLMNEPGPLTTEEQDYLLFLGMVLIRLCADNDMPDANPERLESIDEALWETLNQDFKRAMEIQAETVSDDDAVGIFLIDALHPDEELPFLTGTGALLMYSKLMTLSRAVGLRSGGV